MRRPLLVGVYGPTASGKTLLAEWIARQLHAQLVNADAFQIYRGLDIGTAKPDNRRLYELLDILDPVESFGVGQWVKLALPVLDQCWRQRQSVVIVGGTGFYLRALFEEFQNLGEKPEPHVRNSVDLLFEAGGLTKLLAELDRLDPVSGSTVDRNNPVRVKRALERARSKGGRMSFSLPGFHKVKFGLDPEIEVLEERISLRVQEMLRRGWLFEVETLLKMGIHPEAPGFRAIGYRTIAEHLKGEMTLQEATEHIELSTRQYAKRQKTWLRKEPSLRILSVSGFEEASKEVSRVLNEFEGI